MVKGTKQSRPPNRIPSLEHKNIKKFNARIYNVTPNDDFTLWVSFDDGISGTVVFDVPHLTGMFQQLNDINFFKQVVVEKWGAGIISWPNGVDLNTGQMYFSFKQ